MGELYRDNNIQYGSKQETFKRGQTSTTTVGTYVLDSISINRAVSKVEKKTEMGGPNGWAMQDSQHEGSCVIQLGPKTDKWVKSGDWWEDTLDPDIGNERWVVGPISMPFEVNGYYKANATLTRAHFPNVTPT